MFADKGGLDALVEIHMHGLRASSAEDQAVTQPRDTVVRQNFRDDEFVLRILQGHRVRRRYAEDEAINGDDLHCGVIVASAAASVAACRVAPCRTSVRSSRAKGHAFSAIADSRER